MRLSVDDVYECDGGCAMEEGNCHAHGNDLNFWKISAAAHISHLGLGLAVAPPSVWPPLALPLRGFALSTYLGICTIPQGSPVLIGVAE